MSKNWERMVISQPLFFSLFISIFRQRATHPLLSTLIHPLRCLPLSSTPSFIPSHSPSSFYSQTSQSIPLPSYLDLHTYHPSCSTFIHPLPTSFIHLLPFIFIHHPPSVLPFHSYQPVFFCYHPPSSAFIHIIFF